MRTTHPRPGPIAGLRLALAASMRTARASCAANGDPSTPPLGWPSFNRGLQVMSLVPPHPEVWTGSPDAHHCSFGAAG